MKRIVLIILTSLLLSACSSWKEEKKSLARQENLEWWKAAWFGMFIHWCLYAVPAGEWKE